MRADRDTPKGAGARSVSFSLGQAAGIVSGRVVAAQSSYTTEEGNVPSTNATDLFSLYHQAMPAHWSRSTEGTSRSNAALNSNTPVADAGRARASSHHTKEDDDEDVIIHHHVDPLTGQHTKAPRNEYFRNVSKGVVRSAHASVEDDVDRKVWEQPARGDRSGYFYEEGVGGYMLRHVEAEGAANATSRSATEHSLRKQTPVSRQAPHGAAAPDSARIPTTTSINTRYPLTLAVREHLRAAGDTDILFDSMAFTVHQSDSTSLFGTGVPPTLPSAASVSNSCQRYTRGKEMLLMVCPQALYLLPSERILTAYILEATVHINCSCPFPCMELKILATLPQGIRKRRPRAVTPSKFDSNNNKPTAGAAAVNKGKPGAPEAIKPFTTSTSLGALAAKTPASIQRPFERLTDQEIVAQLPGAPQLLAQQRCYTRIIGFSSEVVLREAVAALTELGKRSPGALSAINRGGGAVVSIPHEEANAIAASPLLRLAFHAHQWDDLSVLGSQKTDIRSLADSQVSGRPTPHAQQQQQQQPAPQQGATLAQANPNKMDVLRTKLAAFRKERASSKERPKGPATIVSGLLDYQAEYSMDAPSQHSLQVPSSGKEELKRRGVGPSSVMAALSTAEIAPSKASSRSTKSQFAGSSTTVAPVPPPAEIAPAFQLADKLLEDVGELMSELDFVAGRPIGRRRQAGEEEDGPGNITEINKPITSDFSFRSSLEGTLGTPLAVSEASRRTRSIINWE